MQEAIDFSLFENKNILVIGDVMIDRYLTGSITRISPEAPVPILNWNKTENRLGGAANVALNIAAMGAQPILCSIVGDDEYGDLFLKLLPNRGLSSKGIVQTAQRKTTVKTRIIADNQHILRVDNEDKHDISAESREAIMAFLSDFVQTKKIDLILFQDYNKGVLSSAFIREVLLFALREDIPTCVDPKKDNFFEYKRVTLFKPNLKEIRAMVPFEVSVNLTSLRKAAMHIRAKLGNEFVLITLSEHGVYLDSPDGGSIIPTTPRKILDVCGAGDTVISVAAVGLAAGLNMELIARLANLAGGQVCEKVGVVPVNAQQLAIEYQGLNQ